MDKTKELPPLHTAVTPDTLRSIMDGGEIPGHLSSLPEATVRASTFVAAIAVGRQFVPPRSTMDIMREVGPILKNALGRVEAAS